MRSDNTVVNNMNVISFNINNTFRDTYNFAEYGTIKFLSKGIVERYTLKAGINLDEITIQVNEKSIKLLESKILVKGSFSEDKIEQYVLIKKDYESNLEISKIIGSILEQECLYAEENKVKINIHIEVRYK